MSLGAIASAAALMAHGFSNAKKAESWHKRNKKKSKERQHEIKEKYKKLISSQETELISDITKSIRTVRLPKSAKKCPECQQNFCIINIKNMDIDCCQRCNSFWFDSNELFQLTDTDSDVPSNDLASRTSKYPCPICHHQMRECVYLKPHNLLVDQCLEHGVYLENRELNRVVEITQKV